MVPCPGIGEGTVSSSRPNPLSLPRPPAPSRSVLWAGVGILRNVNERSFLFVSIVCIIRFCRMPAKNTGAILQRLRSLMKNSHHVSESVHAYIIPTDDAHQVRQKALLRVPSKSQFLVPFKKGFSVFIWCFLHVMLKRSKVLLTKTATLTVRANKHLATHLH